MNLSCSSRMIKYLMFAFNLFFVISGIILIAVGATVKTVYSDYADFLESKYFTLPNMLIATGALIFFVSFFGCCGAIKESWIMLGVFSIFLCIIFIFEFSAGIAGYVLRDKTISYLETTLKNNLVNYPNESHKIWDSIQSGFQCCGVDYYTDWSGVFEDKFALPVSCCPAKTGTAGVFYCNSYVTTTSTEATTSPATLASDNPARRKREIGHDPPPTTDSPATTNSTDPPATTNSTDPPATTNSTEAPVTTKLTDPAATNATTTNPPSTSDPYKIGCKTAFGKFIKKHAVQIGGCALGLAIIQVVEDETTSSSTNQQTLDFPTPSPKTKRKKKLSQVDEAYNFLTEAKGKLSAQDRFSSFGEVIACKLRSLNDPRLQAVAEFQINKILFQVEMQSLNMQPSCPTIVRSSDTLESDNSRPGSSTTNYSYDLSNPITPEMLSPNSETLLSAITTDTNQNSALIELQNVQQLDLDLTKFLKFH